MKKAAILFSIIFTIAIGVVLFFLFFPAHKEKQNISSPPVEVTFAMMSHSYAGFTINIAREKNFFQEENIEANFIFKYNNGKEGLDALARQEVDITICSEAPFIKSVLEGNEIYTIASTIVAYDHLGLIARKDRGIFVESDLLHKKIGVTLGSNGEYFLSLFLTLHRIPEESVEIVNVIPAHMEDALSSGDVDAIVTWNPVKSKVLKRMKNEVSLFDAKGLYSPYFIVCASQEYVHNNPRVIVRILNSLIKATDYILANPEESREIAAVKMKVDSDILRNMDATYLYQISLDQSLLLTLEDQTKWALKTDSTKKTTVPNYLNYFYVDALKEISPLRVTIIK